MKEFVEKLRKIEMDTSGERGDYELFALFLREDSSNKWDILITADWIIKDKEDALRYLSRKIQKAFTKDELSLISRIVIIENDNPALPSLKQFVKAKHGLVEIKDSNLFGLEIKHAFFITIGNSQVV